MTSPSDQFLVVGAGMAGAKATEALREAGFDGPITVLGAERHLPYERPPLSKGFLLGTEDESKMLVHAADWYVDNRVELRLGTSVASIDRAARSVVTTEGERLPYAKLLIATGSTPRRLSVPGAELTGVRYLRTLDDSLALKAAFTPGVRVVIVGGGWIGLEVAAAARTAGADVTVLEHAEQPLMAVLGEQLGRVFADLHREHGVELLCGVSVTELRPRADDAARVGSVVLADGTEVAADVVVVGVGVAPNDDLARDSGLTVDNGVLVDEQLRTSDPDVFAIGDVANAYHPRLHRHVRVEHWANALNQPAIAALAMLGQPVAYEADPYFFTDQYDLGMEYFGYVGRDDEVSLVVRGDLGAREFVAFWLHDGRIVAGMHVNVWDASDAVKSLVASRAQVDPDQLADPGVPLSDLVAAPAAPAKH